jgi:sarcosine oxidase subunit beta
MECDVIVVGGGITGLSVAYNVLRVSPKKVCVFEKRYIGSGASTRNAGRYRVHFGNEENLKYALKSVSYLKKLPKELGYNALLAPTGYLWLIYGEKTEKMFVEKNKLFRRYGVALKKFSPEEVYHKYSFLREQKNLVAAYYGPQNGSFHPDVYTYGLAKKISSMGGSLFEYATVTSIVVKSGEVTGVSMKDDPLVVNGETVVVAAGAWSNTLLETIGIELPLTPVRKEIMVTEPFAYTIEPFIIDEEKRMYVSQTLKGELIGSCAIKDEPNGLVSQTNSIRWLFEYARRLKELLKAPELIRIMRMWSGYYNMTPDKSHIVGRCNDWPEGLYVITGFSGHGFMLGPYSGLLLAKEIVAGKTPADSLRYTPCRFQEGRLIEEPFVVG